MITLLINHIYIEQHEASRLFHSIASSTEKSIEDFPSRNNPYVISVLRFYDRLSVNDHPSKCEQHLSYFKITIQSKHLQETLHLL